MSLAASLVLLFAAIPLVLALLRANELFCLRTRGGVLRVARGRIPQQLLNDIADILREPPSGEVTLRGVVEDRRARLYVDAELTDGQRQRLRNVISTWPLAKIRNAPRR